jgi:hypothetical protein
MKPLYSLGILISLLISNWPCFGADPVWEFKHITDKMTDQDTPVVGTFWHFSDADDDKYMETALYCEKDRIYFEIISLSERDPQAGVCFRISPPAYLKLYRYRIDDRPVVNAFSTNKQFCNNLTIPLTLTPPPSEEMHRYSGYVPQVTVLSAKRLRLQFVLASGGEPVLDIRIQEPAIRQFVSECALLNGTPSKRGDADLGRRSQPPAISDTVASRYQLKSCLGNPDPLCKLGR